MEERVEVFCCFEHHRVFGMERQESSLYPRSQSRIQTEKAVDDLVTESNREKRPITGILHNSADRNDRARDSNSKNYSSNGASSVGN